VDYISDVPEEMKKTAVSEAVQCMILGPEYAVDREVVTVKLTVQPPTIDSEEASAEGICTCIECSKCRN